MKAVEFIRRAIKRSSDKEEGMLIMRKKTLIGSWNALNCLRTSTWRCSH
jgi:hypothetical protein